MTDSALNANSDSTQDGSYTVVARRYRPKSFSDLVGQSNVATALATAIESSRVGHAYLFTGARGVGKTSTARIFAKALNNPGGPSADPDLSSDVAQAIDAGEDIDVIEIDGASNRGIDEIRQLRANVSVRPSRSRFKIYIIDEVHMLTSQAFNALLKTLEEPPEHVKFIFCTTDPDKIPITVLSRCQRFDFPPVQTVEIQSRLRQICESENAEATDDALMLIAKRAAGSMRDSQSLLEQIISFSAGKIDVEQIHKILGSADDSMLIEIVSTAVDTDAAGGITKISSAIAEGVDPGQLAEQLMGLLRDTMLIATGASESLITTADPSSVPELKKLAQAWGIRTLLAAIQLLDETLVKMKSSIHAQVLLEVAVVEMCHLRDLDSIAELVSELPQNVDVSPNSRPAAQKKNDEIATEKVDTAVDPVSIDATRVDSVAEPGVIETTAPSAVLRSNHDRVLRIDNHATAVSTESVPPHETESTNSQIHPDDSAVAESSPKPLDSQTDSANSIVSDLPPNESPQTVQLTNEIGADAQQTELNTISAPHDSTTSPESSHEPSDIDNHDSKAATADASLLAKWNQAIAGLNELFAEYAQTAIAVKINGNGVWNIAFPAGFELAKQQCEQPEATQKLTRALSNYLQTPTQVAFTIDTSVRAIKPPSRAANDAQMAQERVRQASQEPIIQLFKETFKCSITRVDPPNPSKPASEPPAKTPKQDVGSGS